MSNGFNYNYVWSRVDLLRPRPKWKEWVWLWIFPTYVQINDGYVFYYKVVSSTYYFIKAEKL